MAVITADVDGAALTVDATSKAARVAWTSAANPPFTAYPYPVLSVTAQLGNTTSGTQMATSRDVSALWNPIGSGRVVMLRKLVVVLGNHTVAGIAGTTIPFLYRAWFKHNPVESTEFSTYTANYGVRKRTRGEPGRPGGILADTTVGARVNGQLTSGGNGLGVPTTWVRETTLPFFDIGMPSTTSQKKCTHKPTVLSWGVAPDGHIDTHQGIEILPGTALILGGNAGAAGNERITAHGFWEWDEYQAVANNRAQLILSA